jgi:hypothetical protein
VAELRERGVEGVDDVRVIGSDQVVDLAGLGVDVPGAGVRELVIRQPVAVVAFDVAGIV